MNQQVRAQALPSGRRGECAHGTHGAHGEHMVQGRSSRASLDWSVMSRANLVQGRN